MSMAKKKRILVVEDDNPIRCGLCDALESEGYLTSSASDGEIGLEKALTEPIDLVLLDLMLPKKSGLEVLQGLRPTRPVLPVIILTAMGSENQRVQGLKLGADDYVVKPFGVRELLARVESVLRRSPGRQDDIQTFDVPGGQADLKVREVRYDTGEIVKLGEMEMKLLQYLASNPDRPVSRDEVMMHVWQTSPDRIETRTVDMHIARLREKLHSPSPEGLIRTIRGKGYMFNVGKGQE